MKKIIILSVLIVFTLGLSEIQAQVVDRFIQKRKDTAETTVINRTGKEADKVVTKEVNKALDKLFGKEEEASPKTTSDSIGNSNENSSTDSPPPSSDASSSSHSSRSNLGRSALLNSMGISSGNANVKSNYDYDTYIEMTLTEYNEDGKANDPVIYKTYASSTSLDYAMVLEEDNKKDNSVMIFDTENSIMLTLTESDGEKTGFAVGFTPEQSEAIDEDTEEENITDPYSTYKTGKTKKILGYKCEEYVIENENEIITMWITNELEKEMKNSYMQNPNLASLYVYTGNTNGLTMEHIVENKSDKSKSIMTVTEIDMNRSNSISTQGYEILTMGAVEKK